MVAPSMACLWQSANAILCTHICMLTAQVQTLQRPEYVPLSFFVAKPSPKVMASITVCRQVVQDLTLCMKQSYLIS